MLDIEFCGARLSLDASGCLFWPAEKLLVVSDLHLEKGSCFAAKKGVFMPPYDTGQTLEKLAMRILELQPKTVISLGDSFHDQDASLRLPNSYRLALKQLMEGRQWIWVCGNHDPTPPQELGGDFCETLHIGALNFKHEPETEFAAGEIAGHLHPAAKIRQRGKAVRRRCFAADTSRMILPAFGAFTGGLNVRDPAFDGLFRKSELTTWFLSAENIFEIAGNRLVK